MNHRERPPVGRGDNDAGDEVRWTPAATAPDQLTAEMWLQLMREESIPSMLAPEDLMSFLGVTATPVRLLVPLDLVPRAQGVLAELLGFLPIPEAGDA